MVATRLQQRQVRTIAGSSLTTSYQNLGAVVTISAYKISLVNASTTDVQISDGTSNDVFYLPANSTLSIGEGLFNTNQHVDRQAVVPSQTQYQIKLPSGVAGTGIVVITVEGY